jgi:hypothetical protein
MRRAKAAIKGTNTELRASFLSPQIMFNPLPFCPSDFGWFFIILKQQNHNY